MSRLPVNTNIGSVPLRPAARPTDQFFKPEVRLEPEGDELVQLAEAMKDLEPTLQGVIDRRFQAHVTGSQMRAQRDAAKFKNQADLKAAVDRGQIKEADNPWYTVQLRQEVAKAEATEAHRQAWEAYQNNGKVRFSNGTAEVSDFLDGQFAKVIEGRDAYEMEALWPVVQHAKQSILNEHVRVRSDEREGERKASLQNGIAAALAHGVTPEDLDDEADPDPEAAHAATARVSASVDRVVSVMNEASKTVHPLKLEKWVAESVVRHAHGMRDERVARRILDSLSAHDGKRLSDTSENRLLLTQVEEQIHQEKRRRYREEREMEQLEDERQYKSVASTYLARVNEKLKTDPNASLLDVSLTAEELVSQSPDVQARLLTLRNQFVNSQQTMESFRATAAEKQLLQKLYGPGLRGELDRNAKLGVFETLAALGKDNSVSTFAQLEDRLKRDEQGEADPESEVRLFQLQREGKLTVEEVNQTYLAGKLDRYGWKDWSREALEQEAGDFAGGSGKRGGWADEEDERMMHEQVFAGLIDAGETGRKEPEEDAYRRTFAARVEFLRGVREFLKAQPDLKPTEKREWIDNYRDSIAKRAGGLTWSEYQERLKREPVKPKVVQPAAVPLPRDAGPVERQARIDPVVGQVTDADVRFLRQVMKASTVQDENDSGREVFGRGPFRKTELPKDYNGIEEIEGTWLDATPLTDQLTDLRHARANASNGRDEKSPEWKTRDDEKVIAERATALRRAAALRHQIEAQDVVGKFRGLLATVKDRERQNNFYVTQSEKRKLILLSGVMREYSLLRQEAGFTPEEAKTIGPDAWKQVPMFANELDLFRRGRDAAAAFGLSKPEEVEAFNAAQSKLIAGLKK